MLNVITDWIFENYYVVLNTCGAVLCLVISLAEMAQDEIEELVKFKEEKNDRIH